MFFPSVVAWSGGPVGAAGTVREPGPKPSQVAYWIPANLLLFALRRPGRRCWLAEASMLLAVGADDVLGLGLPAHLAAVAGSVAVTVAVLTTMTAR